MSDVDEFNRIMEDIEQGAFDAETPVDEAAIARLEDALTWQAEYEKKIEAIELHPYKVVMGTGLKPRLELYVMAPDSKTARDLAYARGADNFVDPVVIQYAVTPLDQEMGVIGMVAL
jgi:hypothetical protein